MSEPVQEELLAALNELLEGARRGVSVVQVYLRSTSDEEVRRGLSEAIVSQARICSTLYRHIRDLGGEPSTQVAPVAEEVRSLTDPALQMDAWAKLLANFIQRVERHLSVMDAFSRDFFTEVLAEQRRHLNWARNLAMRYNL